MGKSTGFSYTYSAAANKEIDEIRKRYLPKVESRFEELKRLDRQVQTSGSVPSLTAGIIGFLLFGLGVCMSVKIVGESMVLGVLLGLVGLTGMLLAYPIYRRILEKTKDKFVPRILELTSELIGENMMKG